MVKFAQRRRRGDFTVFAGSKIRVDYRRQAGEFSPS